MGGLLAWKSVWCSWAVPVEARRGWRMPWPWNYRWRWAAIQVAGNQTLVFWKSTKCSEPMTHHLSPPNTSQRSTISEHPSVVGWNFHINFRGGKLCSKHSSSSLYDLPRHVTLILFTEWAQEAPHLFAQPITSPFPLKASHKVPLTKACWAD